MTSAALVEETLRKHLGFRYSQTSARLWRKTRGPTVGSPCVGTDLNRNWPYKWRGVASSSTNPCDETFRGTRPGDTTEIKALTAFLKDLKSKQGVKMYIDWHSYSQLFMLRK